MPVQSSSTFEYRNAEEKEEQDKSEREEVWTEYFMYTNYLLIYYIPLLLLR